MDTMAETISTHDRSQMSIAATSSMPAVSATPPTTPLYNGAIAGNRAVPFLGAQLSGGATTSNQLPPWRGTGGTTMKTASSYMATTNTGGTSGNVAMTGVWNPSPLDRSPTAFALSAPSMMTSSRTVTNNVTTAAVNGATTKGLRVMGQASGQGSGVRPLVARTNSMLGTSSTNIMSGGLTTRQLATGSSLAPPSGPLNAYSTSNLVSGSGTTTMAGNMTATSGISVLPAGQTTTTNRTVTGQQAVVGTNTWVDESRIHVVSERVTEHEVRIPKRVVREEIIEKVIVVPEKLVREEVIEEVVKVRQKIIELAKPIIQETIVEVPEIEYVERLVEVPEIILQEKVREIPRIEYQERVIEIPKIIPQEKIVEVAEIEYVEVFEEKIIEVPEIHEQVVIRQVPVPQYIDKPVPEYRDVEVVQDVTRSVPIPVEAITTLTLHFPKISPRYRKVDVPLYVPRFIEIAVPCEMMDEQMVAQSDAYARQVAFLASQSAASLCELENLGGTLKNMDITTLMNAFKSTQEMTNFFDYVWTSGRFQVARNEIITEAAMSATVTTAGSRGSLMGGTMAGIMSGSAVAGGYLAGNSAAVIGQAGRPFISGTIMETRPLSGMSISSTSGVSTTNIGTVLGRTVGQMSVMTPGLSATAVQSDETGDIAERGDLSAKPITSDLDRTDDTIQLTDNDLGASTSILRAGDSSLEQTIHEEDEIAEHSAMSEIESERDDFEKPLETQQ